MRGILDWHLDAAGSYDLAGLPAHRFGVVVGYIGFHQPSAGFFWWDRLPIQLPKIRKLVRPIYQQLGILSQVATGIQTSSNLTLLPENH
jgi:hypothetical protein